MTYGAVIVGTGPAGLSSALTRALPAVVIDLELLFTNPN